VEFAFVVLPLMYLICGAVQYGAYFWAMQSGTSAVADASRRVAVGNCQTTGQVQTLIFNKLGTATTAKSASGVATTVTYTKANGTSTSAPGEIGGSVTVTATFPVLNLHFPFVPVPNNAQVTRSVFARVEDTSATQGTCS
jgi:Flp pilus assembly protein TadG